MPTSEDLFVQLNAAIDRGDADDAYEIARAIEALIVASVPDPEAVDASATIAAAEALEDRLRKALARLGDVLRALDAAGLESFDPTRGVDVAGDVQRVWFWTDRVSTGGRSFSNERADTVTRGTVDVFVPKGHRRGQTKTSWWERLKRFDFASDALRIQDVQAQDVDAFFAGIRAASAEGDALFFLHGYKNTFEDAAIRAAQLAFDLGVPGPVAFFSWPSRGSVIAYIADGSAIEASQTHITDAFVDFVQRSGARKVHVIAHSMGNRALLKAVEKIQDRGLGLKLGQVFLAAPDVDSSVFRENAPRYAELAERTTLYTSDGDRAVWLSAFANGAARAGYFRPYTVAPGVDTVAVPKFDLDLLGHSYFAQAGPLLSDMQKQMLADQPPGKQRGMDPASDGERSFWELRP